MPAFSRLIRFVADNGRSYYGDAILPAGLTDISKSRRAKVIKGDIFGQHHVTDEIVGIRRLLSPLDPSHVRTVRCLGLNYADHAKESNMPRPKYPILFYKPVTSLSGALDPIPVPYVAQEGTGLDYECELVIVIGKPCRDVPESDALDYILGYSVGNDVSHRDWQLKWGGGQWAHGKGYDGWAPYGPGIVTTNVLGSARHLRIWTRVNGELRQNGTTSDLIFGCERIVSLLSRGVTLMPGDVIFTGTPAGVGMGRTPPVWLQDGDTVEVGLEEVGTCFNKIDFQKDAAKL